MWLTDCCFIFATRQVYVGDSDTNYGLLILFYLYP